MKQGRETPTDGHFESTSEPGDIPGAADDGEELFYGVHVFCCVNERPPKHRRGCCSAKGARNLCDYMCRKSMALGLKQMRVNHAGCLNRCELGPTMVIYPEGVWYTYKDETDIDEILRSHVMGGRRVKRLLLRHDEGPRH